MTKQAQTSSHTGFLFLLKDMKIGPKLAIGFGILVALTLLSAGVSYLGSFRATTQINKTDDVRVPVALVASRAQANLLRMLSDGRGYLVLGDQEYRDSYNQSELAFRADLAELAELSPYLGIENNQRLADLQAAYTEWAKLPDTLFELRNDQLEREPAYRILATDGIRTGGKVLIDTNSMIEAQGQREPSVENMARLQDMAKFQGNFTAMLSALRGYVTTRNRIFRQEYEVNLADNQNAWNRLQDKRSTLTSNQQKLLDNIAQNRETFLRLPDQMFDILEGERWREDLYLFRTEAVPLTEKMQQILNEMTNDQQTLLRTELAVGRQDLVSANQWILIGGIVALVVGLAMAYLAQENIAGPVRRLTSVAEQIRTGDLDAQAQVESKDEIGILAETFNNMTGQLRRTLTQVRKEKKRADDLLNVVIPIGVELASEKDFNRLLEKMLLEAKAFCRADAGTLYLLSAKGTLEFVIVRNDSQRIALGGTAGQTVPYAPLPLHNQAAGNAGHGGIAVQAALSGVSSNIAEHNRPSEIISGYQIHSLLTIPLKSSLHQVLGVLQLINAQDPETGQVIPFDNNLQQMIESFSSLAAAALEAYIREQSLHQQIQQLKIEIDEAKRHKQVSEIVDTDFFQGLKSKAHALRQRRSSAGEESPQA